MNRPLKFDLSPIERNSVRSASITTKTRSVDYRAYVRPSEANGNDGEEEVPPPPPAPQRTNPLWYAFCCCVCLVCTAIFVIIVVAATQSGSTHEPTPSPTAMQALTFSPPPPTNVALAPVSSGGQSTSTPLVELSFVCNVPFNNGTCRAVFTYNNALSTPLRVAVGAKNHIGPGPANRQQRTSFKSGYHFGGATFLWNCVAHRRAEWTVESGGAQSTAQAPHTFVACPPIPKKKK